MKKRNTRIEKGNSLLLFPSSFVVFDIETTGLDPASNEIIEIGAIKVIDNKVIDTFQVLIKPVYEISPFITNLTGITNEMVESASNIESVLPDFMDFVEDLILVGHNVNFDINFIYDNLIRLGYPPLKNDFIDTLRVARKYLPMLRNHRLGDLAEYYMIDTKGSHRALKDVEMTLAVFYRLKEKAVEQELIKNI